MFDNLIAHLSGGVLLLGLMIFGLSLLLIASWTDIAARQIPNALVVGLLAIGVWRHGLEGDLFHALFPALLIFFASVFAWQRGWLGGGDAKLMLGASMLVAQPLQMSQLLLITICGGVLALGALLARPFVSTYPIPELPGHSTLARVWRVELWRLRRGGGLPYAVAITLGTAITLAMEGR